MTPDENDGYRTVGRWEYFRMKLLNKAAIRAGTFCTLCTHRNEHLQIVGASISPTCTVWVLYEHKAVSTPGVGDLFYMRVHVNSGEEQLAQFWSGNEESPDLVRIFERALEQCA